MFKLLNRISIVASVVLGFCITLTYFLLNGWTNFDIYIFVLFLSINIILSTIIKISFFSTSYIKSRLEFFFEATIERQEQKTNKKKTIEPKNLENKTESKIFNVRYSEDKNKPIIKKVEKKDVNNIFLSLVKSFFSKNLLAKLGAILVFLGVMFLLLLVWNEIPNLLRIIIGFSIGFLIYLSGVYIGKKGIKQESQILIGTGLLINFLVILGGTFMLEGTSFNENYLSTGASFVLLIMNTLFAVITGLLYKSKPIIYLSFLFAYINPLLTGGSSDNPYTLLVYSSVVSSGAVFLGLKLKDNILIIGSLILSGLIILIAPFSTELGAITKIIFSLIIGITFGLTLIQNKTNFVKTIFGLIGIFVALNTFIFIYDFGEISNNYLTVTSIIFVIYMIINYILTIKKDLKYLYSISSIITSVGLWVILYSYTGDTYITISIAIITGMIVSIYPFFNKNILGENSSIDNLILGNIAGIVFAGSFIFNYGNEYFPGLLLGFSFVGIAIYYFLLSIILIYKFPIEKTVNIKNIKNNIYNYLAISLTAFSISIAIIFETSDIIISIIWLIEASLLYYFYNKTNINKIFYAATILFFVGVIKLIEYSDYIIKGEHLSLVSVVIVLVILLYNIKKLYKTNNPKELIISHDILHIIGIISLIEIGYGVVDNNLYGLNIFVSGIIITIVGGFYAYYGSNILKIFYITLFIIFGFVHIGSFDAIKYNIERYDLNYLIFFQYLTTIILSIGVYIFNRLNIIRVQKIYLNISLIIYLLVIVSLFIYNYFENTFAVTIFWGIVSIYLLIRGISLNKIKYRTLGLYLLSLVILKIFLFDIWYSIEDAISRVLVFIVLGILLIIVSIRYSKKYGDNLVGEFDIKNFKKIDIIHEVKDEEKDEIIIDKQKVTYQIKNIDISSIESATFKVNGKTSFTTKSKNLLQITKYVINKTGKLEYKEGELLDFYDFLITSYISELNSRDLKKVKEAFKDFAEKGGIVILK